MRAGLYERVSTDRQAERYGLGAQDWELKNRAQERGYTLVPDEGRDAFIDDGYSGGELERPALARLRQAARDGRVDVVLSYDPDRLSRHLADLLLLDNEFDAAHVRLEFITQEHDSSPEGKLFFAIRGAVGEYEKAKTREGTTRGRREKARQGKVVNPRGLPKWLRYDQETGSVQLDEEWAQVLRLAYHLVAEEGLTQLSLAKRLRSLGIRTPQGGTHWQATTLGKWLRSPAAKGEYPQLRYEMVEPRQRRKPLGHRRKSSRRVRPKEQWMTVSVPAAVSAELWDSVQRRLDRNKEMASRNTRREYLLQGLLRCGGCGTRLLGSAHGGSRHYRCSRHPSHHTDIHGRSCNSKAVRADPLEGLVWDAVTHLLKEPEALREELRKRGENGSVTREITQVEIRASTKRLQAIPQEQDRLVEGYDKELIPDDVMRHKMATLKTEREQLRVRVGDLERKLIRLDVSQEQEAQAMAFAEQIRAGLNNLNFTERRQLLRLLVDDVICYDDKAVIHTVIPLPPTMSAEKGQLHTSPREGDGG